jgi:manganese transport protein
VWVLLMSNLMAVLLQTLSARLGVVTGKDLAQACRDYYPRRSCPAVDPVRGRDHRLRPGRGAGRRDRAQAAVRHPALFGVLITALDVLLLLALSRLGMRRLEALIVTLVATIRPVLRDRDAARASRDRAILRGCCRATRTARSPCSRARRAAASRCWG